MTLNESAHFLMMEKKETYQEFMIDVVLKASETIKPGLLRIQHK